MPILSRIVFTAFDRSPSRTLLCLILTIGHLAPRCCVSAAPCTVCRDGSAVTLPEKKVQISALYPEMQCSSLDSLIPNLFPDENSEECGLIHQFSTLCGCPIPENACTLCPDGLAVGAPDAVLNENYAALIPDPDLPPTCDLVQSYLHSVSKQDELCVFSQYDAVTSCGCSNATTHHNQTGIGIADVFDGNAASVKPIRVGQVFGSKSSEELETLYQVSRVAALMSIVASIIVLQDCLRKRRIKNVYNQIIATMAVFDILFSIAMALGRLPMPAGNGIGVTEERMGTDATCKAQGFFVQLGLMASLFFNASLSTCKLCFGSFGLDWIGGCICSHSLLCNTDYVLVIIYFTSRSRFRQLRKWLIGIPIVIGVILAGVAVPFVATGVTACQLVMPIEWLPKELEDIVGNTTSKAPILTLQIIPGYIAIAFCTLALIWVVARMRKVDRNSMRWKIGSDTKNSALTALRMEVFWQSFTYLVALYVSWLLFLCITIEPEKYITSHYELWFYLFFATPLQGFLNAICYFRPRVSRYLRRYRKSLRHRWRKSKMGRAPWMWKGRESANVMSETTEMGDTSGGNPWAEIAAVEPAADLIDAVEKEQAASVHTKPHITFSCGEADFESGSFTSGIDGRETIEKLQASSTLNDSFPAFPYAENGAG